MDTQHYFEEIGIWPRGTHGVRAYVVGFILSLVLTFAAYYLAVHHLFNIHAAMVVLVATALMQFIVQILFFLHLRRDASSRDRFVVLGCAVVVVFLVMWGSLWIMFNLNGRQMPSEQQMEQYMNNQAGI